jgi:hypothetical protein
MPTYEGEKIASEKNEGREGRTATRRAKDDLTAKEEKDRSTKETVS